jgi:hypothetical protein
MLTIVLVVLAGFGALSLLWAVFGGLLPSPRGMVLLQICGDLSEAEMAIHRHRWLAGVGALRCPLVLLDGGLSEQELETLRRKDVRSLDLDALEDLLDRS